MRLRNLDLPRQWQGYARAVGIQLLGIEPLFQLRRQRIDKAAQRGNEDEGADQQADVQVQTNQQRHQGLLRAGRQWLRLGAGVAGS